MGRFPGGPRPSRPSRRRQGPSGDNPMMPGPGESHPSLPGPGESRPTPRDRQLEEHERDAPVPKKKGPAKSFHPWWRPVSRPRFIRSLVVALALWLGSASVVLATPDANPLQLGGGIDPAGIKVFRNVLELGDYLLVTRYNIQYATEPTAPASETYLLRLLNGTTSLGTVRPYSLFSSGTFDPDGYQHGIASMYWSAASAPCATLAACQSAGYTVRIEGNPTGVTWDDGTAPVTNYTMQSGDIDTAATVAAAKTALATQIMTIASALESSWGVTLTIRGATGTVLSPTGASYFAAAIPGLVSMAPTVFPVNVTAPTANTDTYSSTYEQGLRNQFDTPSGTTLSKQMIHDPLQRLADWLGVNRFLLTGLAVFGVFLFVMSIAVGHFRESLAGVLVAVPVLLLGASMGFLVLTILFIVLFFCVLFLGWVLFFRPASG